MFKLVFTIKLLILSIVFAQYDSECVLPSKQKGRCVPIKSCKTTYERLNRILKSRDGKPTPEEINELLALQCGKIKSGPLVCCSEQEIQLNVDGLDILKNTTTCGQYSINRVAHGHDAYLFAFPWMVLLKYNDEKDPFQCSGTIISDQYVLTAAHCVTPTDFSKTVRLGEHQISTEKDCITVRGRHICAPPVEDVGVEEIMIHQKYVSNIYHDIALLRLNRKIKFQRHIKPLCLPIYDELRSKEHDHYIISGWGKTENNTDADILQVGVVPRMDRRQCEYQLSMYRLRSPLMWGHICAGGKDLVDTCRGDSGGPLGYRDFYNGHPRFIQFGIVSFGVSSCGVENAPGVYVNTSYYMQWITDHMM